MAVSGGKSNRLIWLLSVPDWRQRYLIRVLRREQKRCIRRRKQWEAEQP